MEAKKCYTISKYMQTYKFIVVQYYNTINLFIYTCTIMYICIFVYIYIYKCIQIYKYIMFYMYPLIIQHEPKWEHRAHMSNYVHFF